MCEGRSGIGRTEELLEKYPVIFKSLKLLTWFAVPGNLDSTWCKNTVASTQGKKPESSFCFFGCKQPLTNLAGLQ